MTKAHSHIYKATAQIAS